MTYVHGMPRGGGAWIFHETLRHGLDLVFPPRCLICRCDLPTATELPVDAGAGGMTVLLCRSCIHAVSADGDRCLTCGVRRHGGTRCDGCSHRWHGCDGLVVLGGYADQLREAVLACKRPAGELLAGALATLLVARHRATLMAWGIDAVVPVPMHWWRRMLRGTSAADELAAGIAAGLAAPRRSALRRGVATPMQNELPVADRGRNVRDAFRPRLRLDGRTVLLVDDVCTTGSTLAACRQTLMAAGAGRVYAAVVAKADRSAAGENDGHG